MTTKPLDDTITNSWVCIYCAKLIEVHDKFTDALDHLLDFHRAQLIAEKPILLRDRRP